MTNKYISVTKNGKNVKPCLFGLHDWHYFTMSLTFIKAFPDSDNVSRSCPRCHQMQYWNSVDKKWVGRL